MLLIAIRPNQWLVTMYNIVFFFFANRLKLLYPKKSN